ncbi:MAG: DM13 domain-containing protein [Planktomarina sp.]
MGRFLKIAIPTFTLGAVFGAAMWYLFSPLFIDQVVDEQLVIAPAAVELSVGQFEGADRVHQGAGTATLIQNADGSYEVQLSDFEVTNGPDLKVYVSGHAGPTSAGDVTNNDWVSLGALKGNIGDQAYKVPADVDRATLQSVVIWCEQFGVLFATAALS